MIFGKGFHASESKLIILKNTGKPVPGRFRFGEPSDNVAQLSKLIADT